MSRNPSGGLSRLNRSLTLKVRLPAAFLILAGLPLLFMPFIAENPQVIHLVLGLISLTAAHFVLRAQTLIVRPLDGLRTVVKEMTGGKFDHQINPSSADEIGLLAADSKKLGQKLENSKRDLRRRYSQLNNLYRVSQAVSISKDIDQLMRQVLKESLDLIGAQTGSIMMVTPDGGELTIRAAQGLDESTIARTRVKLGEGISGSVAAGGKPLMIKNGNRKTRGPDGEPASDSLSVPLRANEKIIGVMNANNKAGHNFNHQDLRFFGTLAGQIAPAIANAELVDSIRQAYFNTIRVLAAAIDAKDRYTHGHSERVAKYAVTIAKQLGLPPEDLVRIEAAAYLHDIGKIGVPDNVLNKDGALSDEEFAMIQSHPAKAAQILEHIDFPWGELIPGVRGHHERYDGRGYPDRLAAEEICRDAQIIAVADSFDAMTSDRPYRKAMDRTKAITELINGRNKQFESQAVDAFIPALLTDWMSSLPSGIADRLEFLVKN
jgi:putative nucleotidyltransferase with HDIG domain